ncbi:MAG: hypothetical protein Tsb0013_07980 [Phycisphaerales bacterium]
MTLASLINNSRTVRSRRGGVVAGCLIALAIVVVLAIVGIVILMMNWRGLVAAGIDAVAEQAINESSLPASEKPELIAIIKDTTQKFQDGDIDETQLEALFNGLASSNVWHIGAAYSADNGYVQTSGLTDEEKADGSVQLMRIAQGLHEDAIDRADYEAVFAPIVDTSEDATFENTNGQSISLLVFRDASTVTDEEIKQVIESARTLADEAGVTAEPEMIDLSDTLQAEIDAALSGEPAGDNTPTADESGESDAPADDSSGEESGDTP